MSERLTTAQVAERAGIAPVTWRAYVHRSQAPKPDGWYDARTPWWYESTVDAWLAARPRRRTDSEESTMTTNITTDRDARDYVTTAIEAGDARREEFDIEAICDELHDLAGGWDFAEIDHDTFWAIVAKHAQ